MTIIVSLQRKYYTFFEYLTCAKSIKSAQQIDIEAWLLCFDDKFTILYIRDNRGLRKFTEVIKF